MLSDNLLTKRRIEKLAHQYYGDSNSIDLESISSDAPDVFISYSHQDIAFVKDVIAFLFYAKGGTHAYADRFDAEMDHEPNLDTAESIKKKIRIAKKVIFIASYQSLKSPWCNWKIGLSDGIMNVNNVAILSAKANNGRWLNNEYLQQYPLVSYNEKKHMFIVLLPNGESLSLYDWITDKKESN